MEQSELPQNNDLTGSFISVSPPANSDNGLRGKIKRLFSGFNPKRYSSIGLTALLVVALPALVLTIVASRTSFLNRAATGEPPATNTPLYISEYFSGTSALNLSTWGASGSIGFSASLENDRLKIYVPQGNDQSDGNDGTVFPYVNNGQIPKITGDFTLTVDFSDLSTTSGWQQIKFWPGTAFVVRRTKIGTTQTLEVWSSPNNAESWTQNRNMTLPAGTGTIGIKMTRLGKELVIDYNLGGGFVNFDDVASDDYSNDASLPALTVENTGTGYPATTGYFDNYLFSGTMLPTTTTPTQTPISTCIPMPTPYCRYDKFGRNVCEESAFVPKEGYCTPPPRPTLSPVPTRSPIPTPISTCIPMPTPYCRYDKFNNWACEESALPPNAGYCTPKPYPTPSAIPTRSPIPSPIRSIVPTPSPIAVKPPIISTGSLPSGYVGRIYSASVSGYDNLLKTTLNMTITNLPRGLSMGPCTTPLGRRTGSTITCYIQGRPTSWGLKLVQVKLTNSYGRATNRTLPIVIYPSFLRRLPTVSPSR